MHAATVDLYVRVLCVLWPLSPRPGGGQRGRARFTKLVNRPGKHERRRKGLSAIRGVRRRSKMAQTAGSLLESPVTPLCLRAHFLSPFLCRHSLCLSPRLRRRALLSLASLACRPAGLRRSFISFRSICRNPSAPGFLDIVSLRVRAVVSVLHPRGVGVCFTRSKGVKRSQTTAT